MKSCKHVLVTSAALLAVAACSPTSSPAPTATCPTSSEKMSLEDLRVAVGANSDVFVAKITGHESSYDGVLGGPSEIYRVEVSNPLMGSANGPARIEAGSELINGKPCRFGSPLPEVGKSYLVIASYDAARQVFRTGEGRLDMPVLTDPEIAKIGTPDEPAAVKDMREAIKSPIHLRV